MLLGRTLLEGLPEIGIEANRHYLGRGGTHGRPATALAELAWVKANLGLVRQSLERLLR
jgi:hypothetical protein